ncbi:hypothetical protein Q3C01_10925 [Bradyrhizobium sp. UFLA05-109]
MADPKWKTLQLKIKPLLSEGTGLRFDAPNQVDLPLEADLERIRSPNTEEEKRYAAGATTLPTFSARAAAGAMRFKFHTEAAGCFAIVLAILNESGFPLDHLVRWVATAKPGDPSPACQSEASGQRLQQYSGLDQLLRISLELEETNSSRFASAAFHIFDTPAGSFVVFVDGRANRKKSIFAWQTGESIANYVSDPHRLPLLIQRARDAAQTSGGSSGAYIGAAKELADILFSGQGDAYEDEAAQAKAAFQELVAQSPSRPVVVVRVVSDAKSGQNRSVFLPLGILGAAGNGAVLTQPITVMQPLPRESYAANSKACVGDWTFGVPPELDRDNEDISQLWPPDASGKNWVHDVAGLKAYLSDASPVGDQPGQGFVLLAHHGNGNLWFDDEAQRVIRQNVTRRFPGGSVAVFAACSVATASYDTTFVQRFNERGVDTLIASPFPVPATYGTRLALEFPQAIEDVRKGAKPTVGDLFAAAIARTAHRLEEDAKRNFREMGLEYVLLGNPNTPLCDKP